MYDLRSLGEGEAWARMGERKFGIIRNRTEASAADCIPLKQVSALDSSELGPTPIALTGGNDDLGRVSWASCPYVYSTRRWNTPTGNSTKLHDRRERTLAGC
ncbi:hypothetical protein PGTUg99_010691 [Puccinia graminis f. sp. tritici]|uniref:Uncharacterized protein n=1 Tax=Puccinia graminis f. sp. tritici TaxID=56615 RepID=A0A5B0S952_PUCGR|nr:hypothetical protein PGTUg99_010691 [Puccinia graminis f. sp. tritici]